MTKGLPRDRAAKLVQQLRERWKDADLDALGTVLVYYVQWYGVAELAERALREVQAAAEVNDLDITRFAPFVSWGLGSSWSFVREAARRIAVRAGVLTAPEQLLARIREGDDAPFLARHLWYRARHGEDLSSIVEPLPGAIEAADTEMAFFLSCAWRHHVSHKSEKAKLPALMPVPTPQPDIAYRDPWDFNAHIETGWTAQYIGSEPKYGGSPEPGQTKRCGVCAEQAPVEFHDAWRDLTGKWLVWEVHCPTCGAYTVYEIDD